MRYFLLIIMCFLLSAGCASTPGIDKQTIFLEKNRNTPGVTVTDSGLQVEVLREGIGIGPKPNPGSKVTLHYINKNIDGTEVDNTYKRGKPASFLLNGVVLGLLEGVQLMEVGSKYRFVIPPELAGRRGEPSSILITEVELINFE